MLIYQRAYRAPFLPKPGFLELPLHGPGRSSGAKLMKLIMLDGPLKRAHQSRNGLHTKLTLAQLPPRKITTIQLNQNRAYSGHMGIFRQSMIVCVYGSHKPKKKNIPPETPWMDES